ncbi:helix-turn-helix transcriptional regulator [Futiania mangrovi]|uniref:HTH luxR-type domain-containing protein n=1 Tax=Futiania mangrovi TaxID=2959716 RepID=A0A9J6PCQ4_9PROT|nr:hypothetical protein [Futiania mangrovii]MCP1337125.1 hypothetical protein [Futiania mangrovii]
MAASPPAELIARIYDTVIDEGWSALAGDLARTFHGAQAALIHQETRTGTATVRAHAVAVPEDTVHAYEAYYAPLSPLFAYFKSVPLGLAYTDADYPDQQAYERSEIYNDFYLPLESVHLLGIDLERSGDRSTYMIVRRGRRAGHFTRAERDRLASLGPHLVKALRLHRIIGRMARTEAVLDALLDRLAGAVILLGHDGRVLRANADAAALLSAGDGLRLSHGRLRCDRPVDTSRLDALLAGQARPGRGPDSAIVSIARDRTGTPLLAEALPLPPSIGEGTRRPAVLLRLFEPRPAAPDPALIAACLGLTPAEALLTAALCRGDSPAAHAGKAGIALHTARTLLKNAMAKTDTHRQAELVSLALSLAQGIRRT